MFQIGITGLLGSLGAVSKIVLLVLLVFSIVSWAVIIFKWRMFAAADRDDQQFMALMAKTKDLDDLCRQVRRMESSPAAVLFEGAFSNGGTINIYEGRVTIPFTVRVPANFRGNTVTVRAAVRYQACTDEVCYPPRTQNITLTARVR